jgi:ribosomal protein S18 acetylase RimI-like enzyme
VKAFSTARVAEPTVRAVARAERAAALAAMTAAFARDPVARWVWPDEREYARRFPAIADAMGGRAFAFGTADAIESTPAREPGTNREAGTDRETGTDHGLHAFDGIALWIPPAVAPDEEAIVAAILDGAGDTAGASHAAGPPRGERLALLEAMGRVHPTEPHWYLPMIGVVPERQGQGLGSALLRLALARCDADRLPAYLESTNPANVPLYERHGFRVVGSIRSSSCPPLTPMLRPPREEA